MGSYLGLSAEIAGYEVSKMLVSSVVRNPGV